MSVKLRFLGWSLIVALAISGCAPMRSFLTERDTKPQLEAGGPGTVFPSVEAAAVDALIYTYLQAIHAHDAQRMRAGTIYSVSGGYSYGEIHTASNLLEYGIAYPLKQRDAARFHMYPITTNYDVNRHNERISEADRRSITLDSRHRPLFILHPSLVVRDYRGSREPVVTVADLRRPKRVILVAGE
jgi:hypothetical protein